MSSIQLFSILPPLVGGFLLALGISQIRLLLTGQSGQRFLLAVAVLGVILATASHLLANSLKAGLFQIGEKFPLFSTEGLYAFWAFVSPVSFESAIALFVATIVAGICFWRERANPARREKSLKFAIRLRGDRLQAFLLDAYENKRTVLLTMETGKVYVGLIMELEQLMHGKSGYVDLLPLMSGHRIGAICPDTSVDLTNTGKIEFNGFYHELYEEFKERIGTGGRERTNSGPESKIQVDDRIVSVKLDELGVILPIADIRSANVFSFPVFAFINRERYPELWEEASEPVSEKV